MKSLKRSCSFLSVTAKTVYVRMLWLALAVDFIEIIAAALIYHDQKQAAVSICLHSNHIVIVALGMVCLGFLYGSSNFSGYLEIKGKRQEYFIGFLVWSYLLASGSMIINRALSLMAGSMILTATGIPGALLSSVNCIQESLIFFVGLQTGFLMGAIYYRVRRISFFVIMGILLYMLCHLMARAYLVDGQGRDLWNKMLISIVHPGSIQGISALLFMGIGCLFLRKAGTWQYAHDRL